MKVEVGQCWRMHESLLPQSAVAVCEQELRLNSLCLSAGGEEGGKGSNSSDAPPKLCKKLRKGPEQPRGQPESRHRLLRLSRGASDAGHDELCRMTYKNH